MAPHCCLAVVKVYVFTWPQLVTGRRSVFLVTAEREWELRTCTSSTGTTLSEGAQMPHDCFSHGLQRYCGEGRSPVTTEALNVQTLLRLPQTPLQREGCHTTTEAEGSPGSATAALTPRAAFPLSLL